MNIQLLRNPEREKEQELQKEKEKEKAPGHEVAKTPGGGRSKHPEPSRSTRFFTIDLVLCFYSHISIAIFVPFLELY
jgi:hypothetical protein